MFNLLSICAKLTIILVDLAPLKHEYLMLLQLADQMSINMKVSCLSFSCFMDMLETNQIASFRFLNLSA